MDPVPNDPHHPPPFTGFHHFTNSYGAPTSNNPVFGGVGNSSAVAPTNNNNLFHAQLPPQISSPTAHPSSNNHPHYSDMICTAIQALNEPDGSSKQAISRYIERFYTGIPDAHGPLLTHHLKTLKNHGILTLVKKSYKFAASSPPTSVAVAAAAAAAAIEHPRSDFTVNENQISPDPVASSTPQTQKRGRGRPPKIKLDVQQPSVVQTNGTATWEQNQLPVSQPEVTQPQPQSIRRPPGRPRKDGTSPVVNASSSGGVDTKKRRGRPPSGRVAGRERKPTMVAGPVSVFPYVANSGVRRRGRPRRVEFGASSAAPPPPPNAESGGNQLALVVAKRGRGRPPKIGGVIRRPMKPFSGYIRTGKPAGRPRKV